MGQSDCECGLGDGAQMPKPAMVKATNFQPLPLLSEKDSRVLNAAAERLIAAGMQPEAFGRLWSALDELSALEHAAQAVMQGDALPGELQALLARIEPWPAKLLSGRWGKGEGLAPSLQLASPGAVVTAAFVVGALEDGYEAGLHMAARSITALIWRAEPIARIVQAARAFDMKQVGVRGFNDVLVAALNILEKYPNPADMVRALAVAPVVLPLPTGFGPSGPLWPPRRPPYEVWLLPENQAWAHCALGLAQTFKPLPDIPKISPPPGRVSPASICGTTPPLAGWTLTIDGKGFGSQGDWGVAVNSSVAKVVSWVDDKIIIETHALQPGCNQLKWTYASSWSGDDNGVGAACAQALRIPPLHLAAGTSALLAQMTRLWTNPGSMSVLQPRIANFAASAGGAGSPAEPCVPVTLTWRIDSLPCLRDRALLHVTLLRDGQPWATGLPFDGQTTDSEPVDRDLTYVLEVTSTDGQGLPCTTVRRQLVVQRLPKRVQITGAANVTPAAPAQVSLRIPCPAPPGGLQVTVTTQPAGALIHPPSVLIPEGVTTTQFTVSAGASLCGMATIVASTPDHLDGSWTTCVQLPPRIMSFNPPAGLKACDRINLSLVAACVTVPPTLRAFAVDAVGGRIALTLSGLAATGTCAASRTLGVTARGLPPGTYSLLIENTLGFDTAQQTFDLVANPRIVRSPSNVTVNAPCGTARLTTLTVTVSGADAVEFTYQGVAQTVMGHGSPDVCGEWHATFSFDFDRDGTVDIVPLFGAVRGAAAMTPVRLATNAAFSVYRLRGPAFQSVSAQLTRVETAPGGVPVRTPEGSIGSGQERDFTLTRCVFTSFDYEYTANGGKVSGSTPELLGHEDGPLIGPHQI